MMVDPETIDVGPELDMSHFHGRCTDIARRLVGSLLLHETDAGVSGGIVVETEAYLGEGDPACHLAQANTRRHVPFRRGAGTVYVFTIYRHANLNVITEYNGRPECVLIRALHPMHGIDRMRDRRGVADDTLLTSGPGRLTEALNITKEAHNDTPLEKSAITLHETDLQPDIVTTPRIGISKAEDWPLRFCAENSPHVSRPVRDQPDTDFEADAYYERFKERPTQIDEF